MVHQFFLKVALQRGLVNHLASKAIPNSFGKQSFSNIFPIFFLDDAYVLQDEGLDSWMDAIARDYQFPENNISPAIEVEVVRLFQHLGFEDPTAPENVGVFQFWVYLFFLYEKLIEENCGGEGNTFAFLRGIETTSTKVVFVGNVPVSNGVSSGYVFHGQKCQTTNQILDLLGMDMNGLYGSVREPFLGISESALDEAKQNCSFTGWIAQGVLLINSCLTHHESGPIYEAWQIFVNFVISHLSFRIGGIPFILFGEAVHKECFVHDNTNHQNRFFQLCHPDQHIENPPGQQVAIDVDNDWELVRPFAISNFILYQQHGKDGMIDWNSIGNLKPGMDSRLTIVANFCVQLEQDGLVV